jgi:predicted GNAT family N-acyltransferase
VAQSGLSATQLDKTLVNSRFAVSEQMRARLLIPALFRHAYRRGISSGVTHSLLAARPSLVPIFERFGFIVKSAAYLDDIAGPIVVMTLDCLDRGNLVRTNSPLLAEYDDLFTNPPTPGTLS